MSTVLITGSRGFVGPRLQDVLEAQGHIVFGFDSKSRWGRHDDITDYECVRRNVEQIQPEWIFHLAAVAYVPESTSDARRSFNVNTIGTLNLLEALRHTGSDARVLISGTVEEYGYEGHKGVVNEETVCRPTTPYGVSKLAAGQLGLTYSRLYGTNVVVTRASNHTGPGHSRVYGFPAFARRVALAEKSDQPVVAHGNLQAFRYYLDVQDVVAAYIKAIHLQSGIYNITPDIPHSMEAILNTMINMAGKKITKIADPKLYRASGTLMPSISSTKFRELTGWEPQIPIEQTIKETLDYWRQCV